MKKILVAILLVAMVFAVVACGPKEPDTYTVTFDSDGGSAVASQTVEDGKTATEPTAPTKEGYTFGGWYVGETKYDFTAAVTAGITLKAKWTLNTYTVSFDTDGGSAIDNATVAHGTAATAPTAPTKDGYNFLGWFIGDTAYDFTTPVTADVALKAKWALITYTVTFDTDGGSAIDDATVAEGDTVTAPTAPTKDGFTFIGWFIGETEYDFTTPVIADITIKAVWEQIFYTVSFDSNGGSAIDDATVAHGATATAPTAPTKRGFKFLGWYVGDDAYDFTAAVTGAIELVAKWELDLPDLTALAGTWVGEETVGYSTYDYELVINADGTITGYYSNGYTDVTITVNYVIYENGTLTVNYNASATEGADMVFTVSADNGILTTSAGVMSTELVLKKQYTVTFDWGNYKDGEQTDPKAVTVIHGEKVKVPSKSWTGYEVKSWKLDGADFDVTSPITSDMTLVAEWGRIECTVTYYNQDGEVIKTVTVFYGDRVPESEVPTTGIATADGASFNGVWYSTAKRTVVQDVVGKDVKSDKDCYPGIIMPLNDLDGTWVGTDNKDVAYTLEIDADTNTLTLTVDKTPTAINWFIFQEIEGQVKLVYHIGSAKTYVYDADKGELQGGTSSNPLILTKEGQKTYTVTFDTDGGSAIAPATVVEGATATKPADPTKDGFTFAGWFVGETEYDFTAAVTADVTVKAKWNEASVQYTVTLTNGTTSTPQTVNSGACAVKPTDPTKSGKVFMGWFDGETLYDFNTPVTSDLNLTAKWGANVIFYNQAKVEVKRIVVELDKTIPANEIPTAEVNDGFVFTGNWHKSYTVSAAYVDITAPITAETKLYPGVIKETITDLEGTWTGEKDGKTYTFTIAVLKDGDKVTGATVTVVASGDIEIDYAKPFTFQFNTSSTYTQLCIKYYKVNSTSTSASTLAINLYSDGSVKLGSPSVVLTKA